MDTNTVKVITEFGQKLDNYINVLSSKLGVAAEHLWPVFVRQQVVEGWTAIIITAFLIILFGFFLKRFSNCDFQGMEDSAKETFKIFMFGILIVICLIVGIKRLGDSTQNISQILNPEFHAIQSLSRMVK